jgi:hypothetical protein
VQRTSEPGRVAWSAAINGIFHPGATPLPVVPSAIFLPVIIGTPLLLFPKRIAQMLTALPCSSPTVLPVVETTM